MTQEEKRFDITTISGKVNQILFQDQRSGKTILSLTIESGETCRVKGNVKDITNDNTFTATGFWVKDDKYGWQFLTYNFLLTSFADDEEPVGDGLAHADEFNNVTGSHLNKLRDVECPVNCTAEPLEDDNDEDYYDSDGDDDEDECWDDEDECWDDVDERWDENEYREAEIYDIDYVDINYDELMRRANNGDTHAQFLLGVYCRDNDEPDDAVEWFRLAAEQGDESSQYCLGHIYFDGVGVTQDYSEAIKWFRLSAERGDAEAQLMLGDCCFYALGVEQDVAEAVKWWRKSADQGNAYSQFNLGTCYEHGQGVEQNSYEAFSWWLKAAEQGHDNAQYRVGLCYSTGTGVDKNEETAESWIKKAAEQGHKEAIMFLGYELEETKDIELLEKRAAYGDPKAQNALGLLLLEGKESSDCISALLKFTFAANQGYVEAEYNLGMCYYRGVGGPRNLVEAAKNFLRSALHGYAPAQHRMGDCYNYGDGVEKNLQKAIIWYKKAAEQGHAEAQCELGSCYYYGLGVEQDFTEAVKWYRISAERGYAKAQYNMGTFYAQGKYVERDAVKALEWFHKAAEQDFEPAKDILEKYE